MFKITGLTDIFIILFFDTKSTNKWDQSVKKEYKLNNRNSLKQRLK